MPRFVSMLIVVSILATSALINDSAYGQQVKGKKDGKEDKKSDNPELDKLIKDLRHRDVKVRLKSAAALREMGEDAEPASDALCRALLSPSPKVQEAALNALEKVRPDLYKLISKLVLEPSKESQRESITGLGLLGAKAKPVSPLILAVLRKEITAQKGRETRLSEACFNTLQTLVPDDPDTVTIIVAIAGFGNGGTASRLGAIQTLHKIAVGNEAIQKKAYATYKAALDDPICQLVAIPYIAEYGEKSKENVPFLKKLKLSSSEAVRDAANKAIDKIENP